MLAPTPLAGTTVQPARWWFGALLLVALLPLTSSPVLPFIDFYNHIARYYVLAKVHGDALLQQNYAANWALLTNFGCDLIGSVLLRFVPPPVAGQVMAAIVITSQFAGLMYFNRRLTGRSSPVVALLLVPLLYSFILNWGFANFLFGLGLIFGAAGWWLGNRERGWRAVPVAALFSVGIFFNHAFVFALYGVLIGSLELGFAREARDWRAATLVRRFAPIAAQAVVPIILFAMSGVAHSSDGVTNADKSVARLLQTGGLMQRLVDLVLYRIETIVRVAEGPSYAADAIWMAAMVAVIVFLFVRQRLRVERVIVPALIAGMIGVVVIPPGMFGIGYVADRMPLFLAMTFVAGLRPALGTDAVGRAGFAAIAGLVAVRLATIALSWQTYAQTFDEYRAVTAGLPRGAVVNDMMIGGFAHAAPVPRCSMWAPQLVFRAGAAVPLFAAPGMQPLLQHGALAAGVAALPSQDQIWKGIQPDLYDDYLRRMAAAGQFQYVLVCNAQLLPRPLAAVGTVVARSRQFELIRLH